ncbi:hypothetical protein PCANC_27055 [Puccinia coronata f. sp. avenae]|uniref:No apical meristem-associated C-terminal domain-containing protein n=1 Tax=Puccinia coronata f. sp. avenae TaxID=200324 RepID=A0A2N5TK10_9BASI|nr:hypothetical protein PCANC_27055 [Puccinia coronata f. sp. avenae]
MSGTGARDPNLASPVQNWGPTDSPPDPRNPSRVPPTRYTSKTIASLLQAIDHPLAPTESQEATKTTDQEKKPKKDDEKAKKPPNWRIEEDQSLCTSWINTSKDATVGTDQTKMAFWDRIHLINRMEKCSRELVPITKDRRQGKSRASINGETAGVHLVTCWCQPLKCDPGPLAAS